jgi:hypothetical protein
MAGGLAGKLTSGGGVRADENNDRRSDVCSLLLNGYYSITDAGVVHDGFGGGQVQGRGA